MPSRAFPVVLAAPSGTGKTSIARALVAGSDAFAFSVSATTRPPRGNERDGVDYHFLSDEAFDGMLERRELVEWATVHGNRYGTLRAAVETVTSEGRHVVLDIDVQGARQIRKRLPEAVLVFVFPPSAAALLSRLTGRATEPDEEVVRRLVNARAELSAAAEFDYVVVNDDLDEAVRTVRAVVEAEGRRPGRARDLDGEVRRLQRDIDRALAGQVFNVNP